MQWQMFSPSCSNGRALSIKPKVRGWGPLLDQDIFSLKNFHILSRTSVHESKNESCCPCTVDISNDNFQKKKKICLSHLMVMNIMVNHGSDNGLVAWWQFIICTNADLLEIIDICLSEISQKMWKSCWQKNPSFKIEFHAIARGQWVNH